MPSSTDGCPDSACLRGTARKAWRMGQAGCGGGVGPEMESTWGGAGVSRVSELAGELVLCWSQNLILMKKTQYRKYNSVQL